MRGDYVPEFTGFPHQLMPELPQVPHLRSPTSITPVIGALVGEDMLDPERFMERSRWGCKRSNVEVPITLLVTLIFLWDIGQSYKSRGRVPARTHRTGWDVIDHDNHFIYARPFDVARIANVNGQDGR